MRYERFEIRNFRGIRDAALDLSSGNATRVTSIVGLNESGKTTLLEAIHSFKPDASISALTSAVPAEDEELESLIPKHEELNFNGDIRVSALVSISEKDRNSLKALFRAEHDVELDASSIPDRTWIGRVHRFRLSKHVETVLDWDFTPTVREKGKRKAAPASGTLLSSLRELTYAELPPIRYYPTFLFEVPEQVYLNALLNDKKNVIYRRVFLDILNSVDPGLNLRDHIINRVQPPSATVIPFVSVLQAYHSSNERRRVEGIFSRASAVATQVVMQRWNEVFKDKISDKEVIIEPGIVKASNAETALVSARFLIKDGNHTYLVKERSLGFKWFFCFLLFTQFHAGSATEGSVLYLFDEPASNLHARAQAQLLDSFGAIGSGDNALIYSTHSHHMVNPNWLESAYIVENAAVSYTEEEYSKSWNQRHTEVKITPYKNFVGEYPERISYFQPVLEALDYIPSDLEAVKPALLVEGKSDFYVLKYLLGAAAGDLSFSVMPSSSADQLGPLIALYLGWGRKFAILLDGDKAGMQASDKYKNEFGLSDQQILLTSDLVPGARNLEAILSPEQKKIVSDHFSLSSTPSKKHILRFYQESLASKKNAELNVADRKLFMEMASRLKSLLH